MPTHIYQRPRPDQGDWSTPIRIEGTLKDYALYIPYEGRLQIINSIGPRFVKQIAGDRLPAGASITIDEVTAEIVVAWPSVPAIPGSPGVFQTPIKNWNFESGNDGWKYGQGWSNTTSNAISGTHSGVYSRTPGTSVLENISRYNVTQGKTINASCDVRQGASADRNAGAAVLLQWRDDQGNLISTSEGNRVMSASNNAVYSSRVSAIAPENAEYVNIACLGIRFRENHDLWVDNFKWDYTVTTNNPPVTSDDTYRLTLQVTDVTGRTAIWSGIISLSGIYYTSKPYGAYEIESANVSASISKGNAYLALFESANVSAAFMGGEVRLPIINTTQVEQADVSCAFMSGILKAVLITSNAGFEQADVSCTFVGGTMQRVLIGPIVVEPETANVGATFIQGTMT